MRTQMLSLVGALLLLTSQAATLPDPLPLDAPGGGGAGPAAGPAAGVKLPVTEHRLANGLTVLVSEDHRLPVVAVELRYLVGSSHEKKGKSGFAHLFEHLMFQGSEHHDDEYFKPFEPIGGSVNGTTSEDRTNYFERVPSNYLELALWMESDRMFHLLPSLTLDRLNNQRDVVKNERRQRYENPPYGMAWIYLRDALYPAGHPYQHPVIGSHTDLTAASLDDVKGFFREYYTPANALLTVVGDVDPANVKALAEKYFGGAGAEGRRAPTPKAALPKLDKIVHLTKTDDVKLPRIYLAWHTPALFESGDAELDLLSSVLTTGKTSRLYQPLVYEQKVAKDVSAFQGSMRLSSYYVVEATAAPGVTLAQLEKALLAAMGKALATPPTAEEMQRAVNGYKKDFYQRIEGVVSRASTLSTYQHFIGSADYIEKDLKRYTGASAASVHATAKKWIDLGAYARVDIVPGPKSGGAQ